MENKILFSESQRFKQWWLWLILLGINGLLIFGLVKQLVYGEQFGDKPMSDTGLVIVTVIILLLTVLFLNFRLETQIKEEGVYVRFYPIHLRFKFYPWEKLTKSYVREYNAIMEYGGWGLRIGLFGKGNAFNVSGNKGLQLEFNDSKKLLIGTNKPDELSEILNKLGKNKQ